jgi:hypothetical protein
MSVFVLYGSDKAECWKTEARYSQLHCTSIIASLFSASFRIAGIKSQKCTALMNKGCL